MLAYPLKSLMVFITFYHTSWVIIWWWHDSVYWLLLCSPRADLASCALLLALSWRTSMGIPVPPAPHTLSAGKCAQCSSLSKTLVQNIGELLNNVSTTTLTGSCGELWFDCLIDTIWLILSFSYCRRQPCSLVSIALNDKWRWIIKPRQCCPARPFWHRYRRLHSLMQFIQFTNVCPKSRLHVINASYNGTIILMLKWLWELCLDY